MAIPTPTVPSTVTAVSAVSLNSTQNNKAFYINSGLITQLGTTETTVISVNDIGKRDIVIWMNTILASNDGDDMTMKVKNNGSIIYQEIYSTQRVLDSAYAKCFIIPANTSIEVTFTNATSNQFNVGISAYGYYMESFR